MFYINQTNPMSLNKVLIKQINTNTSFCGKLIIEDVINQLSYVFKNDSMDEIIGFNSQLLNVSIDLRTGLCPEDNTTGLESSDRSIQNYNNVIEEDSNPVFMVELEYSELQFNSSEEYIDADRETHKNYSFEYKPNYVQTLVLNRTEDMKYGIVIDINHLDLDVDRGDYIILGSDRRPKHSKNSVIIWDNKKMKSIYVNSNQTFIQIVTHGSTKSGLCFQMVWSTENKTIELSKKEPDISEGVREQGLHICIRNQCQDNQYYERLRKYLARYLNKQIFDGSLQSEEFINEKQILIFDEEFRGDDALQYCSAKLAVTRRQNHKIPVFTKETLNDIIFRNKTFSENEINLTDCELSLHRFKQIYEIIIYFVIPLICVSLILLGLCGNRYVLTNQLLEIFKKQSKNVEKSRYENINSGFNGLDSEFEASVNENNERIEAILGQTSLNENSFIEIKVTKKRASILEKNFSEIDLTNRPHNTQQINKSI